MARPRSDTGGMSREPHGVSLKVLRLSNPSLARQNPLPRGNIARIPHTANLAFPSEKADQDFILSPILSLPASFGSAYVGETFSCSLCANNEVTNTEGNVSKKISGVRITAEMQTPSQIITLSSSAADSGDSEPAQTNSAVLQRVIHHNLREEGNHTLIVNVNYTETTLSPDKSIATSSKFRTFRKLYQFQAQPCLSVRTKATELAPREIPDKSQGPYGRAQLARFVLEAQLENVSDGSMVLEQAQLFAYPPFKSTSLNWDMSKESDRKEDNPMLIPREVFQLAFLLEQDPDNSDGAEELKANLKRDSRTILGQIALEWSGSMGEKGELTTGNLLSRKRV